MTSPVAGANLLSYYQGQTALSLFGLAASGTSSTSASGSATSNTAILNYLTNKEGITSATSSSSTVKAPTAPWASATGVPTVSAAVQAAVNGAAFVDPSAAKLDAPGGVSTSDYKNLFALYQGLNSLYDIATTAAAAGSSSQSSSLSQISSAQLQSAFTAGIGQVQSFLSNDPFSEFNLTAGKVNTTLQSTVGIPNGAYQTYTTGVIGTGQEETPLKALQGNVQFTVTATNKFASTTVTLPDGTTKTTTLPPATANIDLSGMGSKPRTIDNVVNYINSQLKAAGIATTFAVANLGNANVTTTTNGKTTTTATGDPQWGFTINGSSSEQISFSAPTTSPSVYVGMGTGGATTYASSSSASSTAAVGTQTTTPTGQQLMKLQTSPTIPAQSGSTLPTGGVFAKNLPEGVTSIQSSVTAPDGSVYVLADAQGTVGSQPVTGTQGVALLKYDSSGKLLFSKVLAGQTDATGYSMAVNTDGSVAIAGTNTTPPTTNANGVTSAATTQAFVQVYDSTGAPTWSQTVPATGGASAASGVAFASDGSVYLSGATTGSVGGQTPQGDADEFIQGFDKTGKLLNTTQFGAKGAINTSAGMVYNAATNTLYTAGSENGKAVVRSFALNGTAKPTPVATRTLGSATSVVGIGLTNGQIVVGGNVSTSTINIGNVAKPYTGVGDGFIASISTGLTAQSSDSVTYVGLSGATTTATAMAVSGGQAYLTGTIANDPNSVAAPNATEGFVTGVNAAGGGVSYNTTFPGANGQATPTAISVSATGASVLDQLGLPTGQINAASSPLLTASTAIKAGDSFYVRTSPGGPQTKITITATDTLATLSTKLNSALIGAGTTAVVAVGANSELSITPNDSSSYIELDSQPAANTLTYTQQQSLSTTDVLGALGLSSGVVRTVATINGLTDVKQLREYGLGLPSNLNLTTTTSAQHAANAIQAAMSAVQKAYQDLVTPPTMASEQAAAQQSAGGTAPAYLTNEIANYQAGLQRLTAGQSNTSSSSSSLLSSLF